jgi:hypothetical protein
LIDFLKNGRLATTTSINARRHIAIKNRIYYINGVGQLIKTCSYGIEQICLAGPITKAIIVEAHKGPTGCRFSSMITLHKGLTALYWWPILKKDVQNYCQQCNIC